MSEDVRKLSLEELDTVAGGFILDKANGTWETINRNGEVVGTFTNKNDSLRLATTLGGDVREITDEQVAFLRRPLDGIDNLAAAGKKGKKPPKIDP